MAEFRWVQYPESGWCLSCGTAVNDRGFVDVIADVQVFRNETEISGIVDVYFCATCLDQMIPMVGGASRAQVEEAAYREYELSAENEKLKDEIKALEEKNEQDISAVRAEVQEILREELKNVELKPSSGGGKSRKRTS